MVKYNLYKVTRETSDMSTNKLNNLRFADLRMLLTEMENLDQRLKTGDLADGSSKKILNPAERQNIIKLEEDLKKLLVIRDFSTVKNQIGKQLRWARLLEALLKI